MLPALRLWLGMSRYFESVCELDIIFNFEKAYFILDELILGGEMQETSKRNVINAIRHQDMLQEVSAAPRVQPLHPTGPSSPGSLPSTPFLLPRPIATKINTLDRSYCYHRLPIMLFLARNCLDHGS